MAQAKEVKSPVGNQVQGESKRKNQGAVFLRLMKYVMKWYGVHFVLVIIFIIASVLANV